MSAKSPRHTDRPSLTKIVKRHGNSATKRQAVESLANRFPDERTRALLTELAREESFHRREWLVDARRQAVKSLMEHFPDAQTRALFIELAHLRDDSTAQCVEDLGAFGRTFPRSRNSGVCSGQFACRGAR